MTGGPTAGTPSFSVVIAAYRAAGTLGEAVASALGQTEPPLEVLVADDGSDDDPAAALAATGVDVAVDGGAGVGVSGDVGAASPVRLLRLPHRGVSAARNAAVVAASGEFVALLDADDRWDPTRLARLAELARARPELDLLTTDMWFHTGQRRTGRYSEGVGPVPTHDQLTELLRRNWVGAPAVRRARWLAVGGMDEQLSHAEDWDMWLRLVLDGAVAGGVDEALVDYRIHENSLSASRAASLQGRAVVLGRLAGDERLMPSQRALARQGAREALRRARLSAAEAALAEGKPSRALTLRASVTRGATPGTRLRALAATVAPARAAQRLRARRDELGRNPYDRSASRG